MPLCHNVSFHVLAVLLASTASALAQDAGNASRIETVILSSGGLAEIGRSARVSAGSDLGFEVPIEQVDDILKSLVVRDPSGGVASISLDGLSPVEETFRRLPFTPEGLNRLPELLRSLQGVRLRAVSGGRSVEGAVLGVEEPPASGREGEDAAPGPLLSVLTEAGTIAMLRLRADAEIEILDEAVRDKLREAAEVSGRSRAEGVRAISVSLDGDGEREVGIEYVVPAPVWKSAYRLIADGSETARLQAWAVVENATGEDWEGVDLTLASGAPVTLSQRLHERYWHERPELPVTAATRAAPPPDRFDAAAPQSRSAGSAALLNAEPAPMPAAPMPEISAPARKALASEGEVSATWRLPDPVDLPAGRTLSLPFVDADLPAERVALFRPEDGEIHPVSALMLENGTGTSLPGGILTVYGGAGEGWLGDAELAHLPAGESRLVSFSADRKVAVRTEERPVREELRATLVEGVLRTERTIGATTTYEIEGAADGARTVIVEHPRREGWRFSSDALDSQTPTHHRLRAEIEPGGRATIEARQEQVLRENFALLDTDADTLLFLSGEFDDPETARVLAEIASRKQALSRAETRVEEVAEEIERASDAQARIRDNLGAVPGDSALGQRYVAMLEDEEDRIAELGSRRRDAESEVSRLREELAAVIGAR